MTTTARPRIAVLDYGIGNLRSAERALVKMGADAVLVTEADQARGADGVVLPGVGAFGPCAEALRNSGLESVALRALEAQTPFLGICVGLQLLYSGSQEDPTAKGLGAFPGAVIGLPEGEKRPQMQWNRLVATRGDSVLMSGDADGSWVYFVHSYAPVPGPETVATCDYGGPVVAAVESGPIWGTQFHPEKSADAGLAFLGRFVAACAKEN